MQTISATAARKQFFPLIRKLKTSGPVRIMRRDGVMAVLVDEEAWQLTQKGKS
jgi:PHD/YefM family antitoxin component YafN of YafNO toxin-antitoxin module